MEQGKEESEQFPAVIEGKVSQGYHSTVGYHTWLIVYSNYRDTA